ncbi:class F sortase [Streptomyces sp. WAC 00631]|uniref:class F sortase n=1 Tax=unclassified Streptomyces TaxID=2593676 RepID=UPI000F77F269|nr:MULTISPECIES: class F sortase [unclassified Streptomyces]MCC5036155.1 class F sortase [Streptomyces sp. WAC 00631]MCC9738819.1 class F sortase [Streptomyces sp. MNU89]
MDGGGSGEERVPGGPRRARPGTGVWGLLALLLLVGLTLLHQGTAGSGGPPQPANALADLRSPPAVRAAEPLPRSVPRRVRVPAVRVDAPLTPVATDGDGWIEAPPARERNLAGWFAEAVTPGERGTSVLVGHVDNASGPAVFYSLGAVRPGMDVEVSRADGRTAVFGVYRVEVVAKDPFPAERVYDGTGHAELRVLTCGGGYDEKTGYAGNVVVYARLTSVR